MTKFALPFAAIMMLAVSGPALAVQSGAAHEVRIKYSKAELNTASARKKLDRRIDVAVRYICGEPVIGSKEEADMIRECRTVARETAMSQVPVRFAQND